MARIVHVHHVDKDAFLKGNIEPDPEEVRIDLKFATLLEFKIWIKEFSVKYYRSYTVVHSDVKKRYTVKCEEDGCPWIVHARPWKGGPAWHISSCVATHMCRGKKVDEARRAREREEEEEEERKRKGKGKGPCSTQ